MNRMKCVVLVVLSILWAGGACYSDDWPQFRGPSRDGKSTETGLLKKWPEGGPELLWSVGGLGIGFSSVAISDGRLTIRHGDALMAYNIKSKYITHEIVGCLQVIRWQPQSRRLLGMVNAKEAIPKLRLRLPPLMSLLTNSNDATDVALGIPISYSIVTAVPLAATMSMEAWPPTVS